MISLLSKLFIKDYKNVKEKNVRESYGKMCSIIAIIANFLLSGSKIIVGTIFSSVSVTADGVNNMSDFVTSLVSLISFKLSGKPADKEHPFGHARLEYIAAIVVAVFILILGIEIIKSSVAKIITPDAIHFSILTVFVLIGSILTKIWMFSFQRKIGKTINSSVLKATALDSISDVYATGAVLISTIISPIMHFQIDGYMGVVVAVSIMITGIKIIINEIDKLLGEVPDKELIFELEQYILSYEGVLGVHDIVIHGYGPGTTFASVHIEVCSLESILKNHDIIDQIETDVLEKFRINLVGHLDPIVTNDEMTLVLKELAMNIVKDIDNLLSIHDFRLVKCETHTNLIFDVTLPFDCKKTETEISQAIKNEISKVDKTFYAILKFDRVL